MSSNRWCEVLGIEVPRLEVVRDHREARPFSLFLVALLERGSAMTLEEVAARFEEAGIADAPKALASLRRCRPARPPAYREGDCYHLDAYDDELDLWVFRLGLRPPRAPKPVRTKSPTASMPGPESPLSIGELEEAWKEAYLRSWSKQRLALAALEAHRRPMSLADVLDFIGALAESHPIESDEPSFRRKNSSIEVSADGQLSIKPGSDAAIRGARLAVRKRIETCRRDAAYHQSPAELRALRQAAEEREERKARELAKLRRGLLYAYPATDPFGLALVDVRERDISTFVGDEIADVAEHLKRFDVIGATRVRGLLCKLGCDAERWRLAELSPPQKTLQVNQQGRTIAITTEMLIHGSCRISHAFGVERKLDTYYRDGQLGRLRRRLQSSAKALHALYQYGRLHGTVRIRWGFIDTDLPAPWVYRSEPRLYRLKKEALDAQAPLEVVLGSAPGWEDPWARGQIVQVASDDNGWNTWLVDADGVALEDADVQLARIAAALH